MMLSTFEPLKKGGGLYSKFPLRVRLPGLRLTTLFDKTLFITSRYKKITIPMLSGLVTKSGKYNDEFLLIYA